DNKHKQGLGYTFAALKNSRRKALSHVRRALDFASEIYSSDPETARKAVRLAMKISQKKRLRLPTELRRRFCRKCATPFTGPSTFSVRVRQRRSPHVVVRCRVCGYMRRYLTK
ncbi:MAG: hypothetical protein RMH74_05315, partial [Candidatus Caldarchaeum sp.]|nr:hypothetical protein [Candidatus Caldarchaeum sp.]MDW7978203.1 hypothetical protein [Candidatus Caldarchaeum sp.]